jgi:hypothetical protein
MNFKRADCDFNHCLDIGNGFLVIGLHRLAIA